MCKMYLFVILLGYLRTDIIYCYDAATTLPASALSGHVNKAGDHFVSDEIDLNKSLRTISVPISESSNQLPVEFPCELSKSIVSGPGFVCRNQLLFEDNFTTSIGKGKIWTPEIKFPGEPDYPFNVYLYDNNNIRVSDGKLNIKPITLESKYGEGFVHQKLDITSRCTGLIGTSECCREAFGYEILPPVITAKLTTKNSFSFKYGRIEVGARMPLGNWLIPEIQLEPKDNVYGVRNYASGLLRIATVKGNVDYSKRLYAGPIMSDVDPFRSAYLREHVGFDQWGKTFHNYTMVWRPDGISLYVDGDYYGEIYPGEGFSVDAKNNNVTAASQWLARGTLMAPFDQMFYISLGLSVGGIHEFPDEPNKPWANNATKAMLDFWESRDRWFSTWYDDTNSLRIDYVRVYAL